MDNILERQYVGQILVDLSNPFAKSFEEGLQLKALVTFDDFLEFITTIYTPKRRDWLLVFKQKFMLFQSNKIQNLEFYSLISHLIPKKDFEDISKLLLSVSFDELLEILQIDDVLGYQSNLSAELAGNPTISYNSSLLKKEFEFSHFSINLQEVVSVQIKILNNIQSTCCFYQKHRKSLKFSLQLMPGTLNDIISNVSIHSIEIDVINSAGIVIFSTFVPLLTVLVGIQEERRVVNGKSRLNGTLIQLSYLFKEFTKEKFRFEHVFDAFQQNMKTTQLETLKLINKSAGKKMAHFYNSYPRKIFPFAWFVQGQYLELPALLGTTNTIVNPFGSTSEFMSNKSCLNDETLYVLSKLKSHQIDHISIECGYDKPFHTSLSLRTVEESISEQKMSKFEAGLYLYNSLHINKELLFGWKHGYPQSIVFYNDIIVDSNQIVDIDSLRTKLDEISFISCQTNDFNGFYCFTGSLYFVFI